MFAVGLLLSACAAPTALEREQSPARTVPIASQPPDAFRATVVRVVDGDTLLASRDGRRVRVRLIGIDAPESVQPDAPVECFGPESAEALRMLLPAGAEVRASFQGREHEDRFGRELWDVWLRNGRLLQAELVRRGYARARAYVPHMRYADVLAAEERGARAASLGLHRACRT